MPKKLSILVVDDDSFLRQSLVALLKRDGHRVIGAYSNGAEALSFVEDLRSLSGIDLIVSDVMMPVQDGVAFLQGIKKFHTKDQAKFLFTSGGHHDLVREYVDNKDVYFLSKPYTSDELRKVFERIFPNQ